MTKDLNIKVLDLIFNSVMSEGGDGDAIWLSKHTTIDELFKLIEEYNQLHNTGWDLKKEEKCLSWGRKEEWVIITNDEEFYNTSPDWITLNINY